MNAYNQETNTATDSSPRIATSINRYKETNGDNNTYRLLVKKYSSDMQDLILDILTKDKKMSEQEASDFANNMFSLGDKRQKDMSDEIEDCYSKGKTQKQCAQQLVDKYYKITKVNKYHNTTRYQTNRELGGEGEVTEVDESVKDEMTPKSKEDIIKSLKDSVIFSDKVLEYTAIDFLTKDYVNTSKYNSEDFFTMKDINNICKVLGCKPTDLYIGQEDSRVETFMEYLIEYENVKYTRIDLETNGDADCYTDLKSAYIADGDVWLVNKKFLHNKLSLTNESINEKVKYEQFKLVPLSLFWNFIDRVNDLELKFQFDITVVKNVPNSMNGNGYALYMETPKISNKEVEYEFKHSKMLASILTYITGKESENKTSFYIGFDSKAQLHFGFIINDKRYKIGYTKFNSYTFQKLIQYITGNKDVDLTKLSKKFVTNIESLHSIRTILDLYLQRYEEEIEIYNTVINNNFGIVIESLNDEAITQTYIEDIIKKYVKISHYSNWYVEKMKMNKKTFYYFILK